MQTIRLICLFLLIFTSSSKKHDTTNLINKYYNLVRGAHDKNTQKIAEIIYFKPESSDSKDEKDIKDKFEINSVADIGLPIYLFDKHQIGYKVDKAVSNTDTSKSMITKYDYDNHKTQNSVMMILINRGTPRNTLRGIKSRRNGLNNYMGLRKNTKNDMHKRKSKGEIHELNNCCGYYLYDQGYNYDYAVKKDGTYHYDGQNYNNNRRENYNNNQYYSLHAPDGYYYDYVRPNYNYHNRHRYPNHNGTGYQNYNQNRNPNRNPYGHKNYTHNMNPNHNNTIEPNNNSNKIQNNDGKSDQSNDPNKGQSNKDPNDDSKDNQNSDPNEDQSNKDQNNDDKDDQSNDINEDQNNKDQNDDNKDDQSNDPNNDQSNMDQNDDGKNDQSNDLYEDQSNKHQNDDHYKNQNNDRKKDRHYGRKRGKNYNRKRSKNYDRKKNQKDDRTKNQNYDRKKDRNSNYYGNKNNEHDSEQDNSESYHPDIDSSSEQPLLPMPDPPKGGINFMGNFKNVMKTGIMSSQWNIKKLKKSKTGSNKNQKETKERMCILNSFNEYCIGQEIGSKNKNYNLVQK